MPSVSLLLPALRCWPLLLAGCVAYTAQSADPTSIALELQQRPGGTFDLRSAITTAFTQNPNLQALAARARAAGAVTTPLDVEVEWTSSDDMLAVLVDPVALLGLGTRGAARTVAAAEAVAAVEELAVARWRVAAALAEAFAADRALDAMATPAVPIDANAFVRAGLAAPLAAAQVRAAQARARAEAIELENTHEANLIEVRELLGLHANAPLVLTPLDDAALPPPESGDAALLRRPDLALATARFAVADAEFRRAVAEQYPSVQLGPAFALNGDPLAAMAVLRVPFGMRGLAAAASARRDAARQELAAAYLAASREGHHAATEAATLQAQAEAAAASRAASEAALRAALVASEGDGEAFAQVAETAAMAVRDAMEHRLAAVAAARARVRAAAAFGWPAGEAR